MEKLMKIIINTPSYLQIAELKISLDLQPEMILALFIGYLVMDGKVPEEIQKVLDAIEEKDYPHGWSMFIQAWQNRSDAAVQDVYEILGQMIKDAVKTS
jgi:hypothetical protein